MGIEKFIKGVFTPEEGNELPNARLEAERESAILEKNEFIIKYDLTKVEGYEKLTHENIKDLETYSQNQKNIMPEDLKKEVQLKANEIIRKKYKEAT